MYTWHKKPVREREREKKLNLDAFNPFNLTKSLPMYLLMLDITGI